MASDMNDYFNKKKKEEQRGGGFQAPKPPKMDFNMNSQKAGMLWVIGGIVLLLLLAKPFVIITEGERGILSTNGKYSDEAFLTGTAAELTPIREVDARVLGAGGRGPITEKLQSGYFDIVYGRNPDFEHYLTYIK